MTRTELKALIATIDQQELLSLLGENNPAFILEHASQRDLLAIAQGTETLAGVTRRIELNTVTPIVRAAMCMLLKAVE